MTDRNRVSLRSLNRVSNRKGDPYISPVVAYRPSSTGPNSVSDQNTKPRSTGRRRPSFPQHVKKKDNRETRRQQSRHFTPITNSEEHLNNSSKLLRYAHSVNIVSDRLSFTEFRKVDVLKTTPTTENQS